MSRLKHLLFSFLVLTLSLSPDVSDARPGRSNQCGRSMCGNVEIRWPFRLKGQPRKCGDKSFELEYKRNRTSCPMKWGKDRSLSWERLHDIALGVAKGIEYLHQGCEQRILHFDIKPHNILLDHNFTLKISDFGLAKLCSKDQSAISMITVRGTMGYIAPEVLSLNFGNVSYKSDVYSFGMLLLEMVGGIKNIDDTVENTSQVYFPEWAYNCLDKGEELGIRIEDEEQTEIAKKLTIVGL
ncbi:putative Kinase superfamily protein [Hibiscus syriacus]|uniref:Kinase superfamily protein n=1 Tax=Hibiscus syriacus TaxID=106335 RepID=A0A6A2XHZ4_HIBSY|nr:putative Kinase superfamily protein [Hibiscus syriacus]